MGRPWLLVDLNHYTPITEDIMPIDIVIKNASLVIPNSQIIEADIAIADGRVVSWSRMIGTAAAREIDANGKVVIPGVIDPHVHLGVFGHLAEEAKTETQAAIVGGVTTLGCYVSAENSYLDAIPDWIRTVSPHLFTDVFFHPIILADHQLNELCNYVERLGIHSFKVYMWGFPGIIESVDDGFLLDVFNTAMECSQPPRICVHAENPQLIKRATDKLGAQLYSREGTLADWERTHPSIAESEAVARAMFLARGVDAPVYFVHISSGDTVDILKAGKTDKISVETTSPYLSVDVRDRCARLGKMVPPLRHREDIDKLWAAVRDGTIDTIGTDNTTLTVAEKQTDESIWKAVPGYAVLATHLPVLIEEGYHKRGIPLPQLIGLVTENPAKLFGLYPEKGTLFPGSDADLVILDLDLDQVVHATSLPSRSDFSIYEGRSLRGWPTTVIKSGHIVYENGRIDLSLSGLGRPL